MATLQRTGITGSLSISSSNLTTGSVLLSVDGFNGRVFSVDDNLTGSLFSVNNISGIPVLEAFSDNTIVAGKFGSNVLVLTGSSVGIGTRTPVAKLQISAGDNSDVQILVGQGSSYGAPSIRFKTASTNYMGLGFTTGSAVGNEIIDAIAIQRTGNVGIGTTSPTQKLEVAGYVMAGEGLYRTSIYGNNGGGYLYFGTTSSLSSLGSIGAYGALFNINSLNNDISFQYNSAEKMRVTTGGHLGLGITDPTAYVNANGNWFRPSLNGLYSSVFATTEAVVNLISSGSADGAAVGGVYFTRARAQGDAHLQIAAIRAVQSGTSNSIAGGALQFFAKANAGGTLNTSPQMVIWNDGNVGIGTNLPSTKLDIYDDINGPLLSFVRNNNTGSSAYTAITLRRDAGANGIVLFTNSSTRTNDGGAGNSTIRTDNGNLLLGAGGTTYHILNTAGNVGIGTTSPATKLDVSGSISIRGTAVLQPAADVFGGGLSYDIYGNIRVLRSTSAQADGMYIGYQGSGGNLKFFSNSGTTEFMTIATTGNVGIGSTSPAFKLDVSGSIGLSGLRFVDLSGNYFRIYEPAGGNAIYLGNAGDPTNYYDNTNHAFRNRGGSSVYAYINNNGNLGIGTTSPSGKLQVIGEIITFKNGSDSQTTHLYLANAANTRAYNLQLNSAGTNLALWGYNSSNAWQNLVNFNYNGNVGIGTTAPSASLHANSTTSGATLLRADGTNGTLFSVIDDLSDSLLSVNNSAGLPVFEVFADDRLVAGQYGQNDLVVINNRVGIGTNNPTAKLYVTSSTSTPSAVFLGGSVGIGTGSPSNTKLHILGDWVSGHSTVKIQTITSFASGGTTGVGLYDSDGTRSGYLYAYSTGTSVGSSIATPLIFETNGVEKMRILSGGNVGIGTASPRSTLHVNTVNGSSGNEYAGLTVSATISASRGVNIAYDATNDIGVIQPVHSGVTWKNLQMTPSGGSVAIGNVSPSYKLHVVGDIYANGGWFRVSGTQGYYFETYGGGWFMNDNTWLRSYNSKNIWSGTGLIGSDGGLTVGYGGASPTSLGAIISGSVGIGTSSPAVKLHVVGSSILANNTGINPDSYIGQVVAGNIADGSGWGVSGAIGGNGSANGRSWAIGNSGTILYMGFQNGSSTTSMQTFLQVSGSRDMSLVPVSGSVGVGTTNPSGKVHIYENANRVSYLAQNNVHTARFEAYGTATAIDTNASNGIFFRMSGADVVKFAVDGNVGIGTTAPGRKLDVEGMVRTRGATGTGGFEISAATTGTAKWRIEWDSASDSLDFNWVG